MKNIEVFKNGMRDGVPIAIGYFAVAFSLGISAKNMGISPFQGFFASILTNASAGEYAGFRVIASKVSLLEMAIVILIANLRYLLMSFAISQRMDSKLKWYHRLVIGFDLTDELFAISIARTGFINPFYSYGAMVVTIPCWAFGTSLGIITGSLMPRIIVSALSVALYGMFLAVIIPPCKKNKVIIGLIFICFITSFSMSRIPVFSVISEGTRIIILTVVISVIFAIFFPVKKDKE